MDSPTSYLIIGGCGFLGQHLANALLTIPGATVAVFDVSIKPLDERIKTYQGDLTKLDDLKQAMLSCRPTCVFHVATPPYDLPPNVHWKVNVEGTRTVVDACIASNVTALVFTSSSSVVFDGTTLFNVNETAPFPKKPLDAYNETKSIAETTVLQSDRQNGLRTVALRPSGIFGPGAVALMKSMDEVAFSMKKNIQIGDNTNVTDWTYVGNVVDAHLLAADKLLSSDASSIESIRGQTFFITNDETAPFWNFGREVFKQLGVPASPKPFIISRRTAMVLAWLSETFNGCLGREASLTRYRVVYTCTTRSFDITKAKTVLGYKPRVSINEGIGLMVKWWMDRKKNPTKF